VRSLLSGPADAPAQGRKALVQVKHLDEAALRATAKTSAARPQLVVTG
jgi:hypothetical protein